VPPKAFLVDPFENAQLPINKSSTNFYLSRRQRARHTLLHFHFKMQRLPAINLLCKIGPFFGIFPISVAHGRFSKSTHFLVFSVVLLIIFNCWQVFRALRIQSDEMNTENFVMQVISDIVLQLCVLALLLLALRARELAVILNTTNTIVCNLKLENRKMINWELGAIFSLPVLSCSYINFKEDVLLSNFSESVRELFFIYEIIALGIISSLFCMLCCILKYIFNQINEQLENILAGKRDVEVEQIRNNFQAAVSASEMINLHFSWINLFFLVMQNVYLQQDIYFIATSVFNKLNGIQSHEDYFDKWIINLIWLVYDSIKIFAYFWHCSRTTDEVCACY